MDYTKKTIAEKAEQIRAEIWEIASQIGNNPEQGYKEYYAVKTLTDFLSRNGFEVEFPVGGIETAFSARFQGKKTEPRIAFLAEYDALPDIGHGCGHNLIGAASAGAAVVLSKLKDLPGEIYVVGTPAEETSGAKVSLTDKGIFDGIDAALMFHPGSCNVPEISSLALDAVEVSFYGREAHMAISENIGINALEAMINLFMKLRKMRKRMGRDERIDGIITEGGKAPNIVPAKTTARFYIRSGQRSSLNKLRRRVLNSAQKAADEIGAQMQWKYYECSYDEMRTNRVLAQCFKGNLLYMGVRDIEPHQTMAGSVDMGNVSQVVPAVHCYLQMGRGTEIPHTREFAEAALSEDGEMVLFLALRALAYTGWDVLSDGGLLARIKKEFQTYN